MHPAEPTFPSRRTQAHAVDRRDVAVIGLIALIGFMLRLAAAQGSLWLDEAWSAVMARDAGTPIAVFLGINHDNNHHLNTLWMQIVGFGAAPPLVRALSIASGTISILVAARIGALRDRLTGLLTAFVIAVAPVMVTMGSEARGYAPMSLALFCAIFLVQRSLDRSDFDSDARGIAIAFALGLLSQLTMAFGICAIMGWVFTSRWRRTSFVSAAGATLRLLGPGLLASAGVAALVMGAAHFSDTGFRFGDLRPYDTLLLLHGVIEMIGYTIGWPSVSLWLIPAALIALVLAPGLGTSRIALYRFAMVGFPLGMVMIQAGNTGHPRYYLLVGMALLLMLAEILARGLVSAGWRCIAAIAMLGTFTVGSFVQDIDLIRNQRGDPGAAIRILAERAPHGTKLMIDRPIAAAMLDVAAANQHYNLETVTAPCPSERFLLLDRFRGETFPPKAQSCGRLYLPFAQRLAHGMSGTHWTLYERRP